MSKNFDIATNPLYKRILALKHLKRAVSASDFGNRHAVTANKAYDAGSIGESALDRLGAMASTRMPAGGTNV